MKEKLATITSNPTVKKIAGAAVLIGSFLALKRLLRGEDEIVSEADWVEEKSDETDDDAEK